MKRETSGAGDVRLAGRDIPLDLAQGGIERHDRAHVAPLLRAPSAARPARLPGYLRIAAAALVQGVGGRRGVDGEAAAAGGPATAAAEGLAQAWAAAPEAQGPANEASLMLFFFSLSLYLSFGITSWPGLFLSLRRAI